MPVRNIKDVRTILSAVLPLPMSAVIIDAISIAAAGATAVVVVVYDFGSCVAKTRGHRRPLCAAF